MCTHHQSCAPIIHHLHLYYPSCAPITNHVHPLPIMCINHQSCAPITHHVHPSLVMCTHHPLCALITHHVHPSPIMFTHHPSCAPITHHVYRSHPSPRLRWSPCLIVSQSEPICACHVVSITLAGTPARHTCDTHQRDSSVTNTP